MTPPPETAPPARPPSAPALRLIRWILFASLFVPLVVVPQVLFPYLVPRTVFFRILVEAGLLVLIYLVLNRRTSVDRGDRFLWTLVIFLFINVVAAVLGFAPLRSLFSDLERTWGLFTWLHLVLFYILLRTALVSEGDWIRFLRAALAVAVAVALLGLVDANAAALGLRYFGNVTGAGNYRVSSTLGNPGFLAAYLLTSIAIALLLISRDRDERWRWFYLGAGALCLYVFALARTRSAILGAAVALLWATVWLIFGARRRKIRIAAAVILAAACLFIVLVLLTGGEWLRFIPGLDRIAALDAPNDIRFIVWRDAISAAARHPLIGVGMENAYTALASVFDAARYSYPAGGNVLFDRIHNVYLEVLVTSGALGLLVYLAVWSSLFFALYNAWRRGKISGVESVILSSAFLAYMVYLAFWFEELNALMPVLVLAAYTATRATGGPLMVPRESLSRPALLRGIFLAMSIGILTASLYQYAWRPIHASHLAAKGLASESPEERLALLSRAVEVDVIGGAPLLFQLRYYINESASSIGEIRADPVRRVALQRAIDTGIRSVVTEISRDPRSDLLYGQEAEILRTAFLLHRDPRYFQAAAAALKRAIDLSPNRLHYRMALAELYLIAGDGDTAATVIEDSFRRFPGVGAPYEMMARVALERRELSAVEQWSLRAIEQPNRSSSAAFVLRMATQLEDAERPRSAARLYVAFLDARARERAAAEAQRVSSSESMPIPFTTRVIAASLPLSLLRAGDEAGAGLAARELVRIAPDARVEVERFLRDLERGRTENWHDQINIPIPRSGAQTVR